MRVELDVVIFGGGVAGLWLLDELRRRGYAALLLESGRLGGGQTVAAQGIIHGGFKYKWSLKGRASAKAIASMPPRWRDCLAGRAEPKLTRTKIRSEFCYIWGAQSQWSRFVAWAAGFGLRVKPHTLPRNQWPEPLRGSPGRVYKLGEQVIDPVTLVADLAARNAGYLLSYEPRTLMITRDPSNRPVSLRITAPPPLRDGESHPSPPSAELDLHPRFLIFSAGEGNEMLREKAGLHNDVMQRRPLHMVMVRGKNLPMFFGHCIGGTKPRATITADVDSQGRTVWQIGGEPAESGVRMLPQDLIRHARQELGQILPGIDLSAAEWATYTINRAEAATAGGARPDDVQLLRDGSIFTAWPTKLALAPRLAEQVVERIGAPSRPSVDPSKLVSWPRPEVAPPPWETQTSWSTAS